MASFTDTVPQFNPYVQQLPVEAMVQVGMEKQKRYDEGIQKIQGFIDNIAGLDILRGVDKQYLQSKLNELGNNVTALAAGDFSNYQLVNSVAGMASQIVKDPNIEAAVGSTAFYRKQLANIETAIKEGKSAQSNIYDFNSKANDYMESTDLGRKFSDRYSPYIDVRKKLLEAIKAAHPNATVQDIPFEIGPDGKINTRKIADAMIRQKIEGVDENDIKQIAYATLTPDDLNQIAIDGRYELRDVGIQDLGNRVRSDYDRSFNQAVEAMDMLTVMKRTTSDPKKLLEIEKGLEYYNRQIGTSGEDGELYKAYEDNIRRIESDPDSVKYSIYKDAFISEFANAFSWKNQERLYMTNPLKEQQNFVQKMRQDAQQFQVTTALRVRGLEISAANLQTRQEALAYQKTKDATEQYKKDLAEYIKIYGNTNLPAISLGTSTMTKDNAIKVFNENITNELNNRITGYKARLKELNFSDADINKMINDYNSGDVKRKNSVPPTAIGLIQQINQANNSALEFKTQYEKLEQQAKKETGFSGTPPPRLKYNPMMGGFRVNEDEIVVANVKKGNYINRLNELLYEKYSNVFIPTLKPIGVTEDGKTSAFSLRGLQLISEKVKAVGGKGLSDNVFFGKDSKATTMFLRQNGYKYDIVVKNENNAQEDVLENISPDDINKHFGRGYINNKQIETQILKASPNASTSISLNPNNAFLQSEFGSFPKIRRMKIKGNLLQDGLDENQYVPELSILLKDGNYVPIQIAGVFKDKRVGFDQGVDALRNFDDDDVLDALRELGYDDLIDDIDFGE